MTKLTMTVAMRTNKRPGVRETARAPWMWVVLFVLAAAGPFWLPAIAEGGAQDPDAMMEAWMRAGAPGDHHDHLAALSGTWTVRGKIWMAPDAPPIESSGTMKARMVLGGRYLASQWDTDFQEMQFEGLAMDGWDNLKDRYVGQWWDNMSTQTLLSEGECAEDGKVRTMITNGIDPMSDEPFETRGVTTRVDADHWTFVSWRVMPDGTEHKEMEWHGARASK